MDFRIRIQVFVVPCHHARVGAALEYDGVFPVGAMGTEGT